MKICVYSLSKEGGIFAYLNCLKAMNITKGE